MFIFVHILYMDHFVFQHRRLCDREIIAKFRKIKCLKHVWDVENGIIVVFQCKVCNVKNTSKGCVGCGV